MLSVLATHLIGARVPLLRALFRLTTVAAVVALASGATACSRESTSPRPARLAYGTPQALGAGVARTFVALDDAGRVVSLGVAMSETAMTGLPQTPMPGMPSAAMLSLALPTEAAGTGYNHVMLDWNPAGHEPEHVYTLPHFDFHFFQITPAERDAMNPGNPDFGPRSGSFPAAQFVPADYLATSVLANIPPAAAAVPLMGMHWVNTKSPELQPPPANQQFTSTFIYGSYNGRFIFVEPMITKAYIESAKQRPQGIAFPVTSPERVATSGLYPRAYSITYHSSAKEYRISLDELVRKQSTP